MPTSARQAVQLPQFWMQLSVLAAQAPAANADVREEQHHEDDCEDDVNHRDSNSGREECFLRSIFGFRFKVPPIRGVLNRQWE